MPYRQKGKVVFHVSLDPNCADLLIQDATNNDKQPGPWIRELLHQYISSDRCSTSDLYEQAKNADQEAWRQSYKNRELAIQEALAAKKLSVSREQLGEIIESVQQGD